MDNKIETKKIILIFIVPLIIILLLGLLFYVNINKSITITATVNYIDDKKSYIIVKDNDTNDEYILKTNDKYNVGDTLLLTLYKINNNTNTKEASIKNVNVLSRKISFNIEDKVNNNQVNEDNSNYDNNSLNNNTNKSLQNNESTNYKEEDIINYFNDINNSLDNYKNDKSLSQKIKDGFVTVVDFLFYNKEIKGKTFKELNNTTKLKVLKIALAIDTKIDSRIPGYKESLSTNYNNIKSKIVENYLDITSNICSNNESTCKEAKAGLTELKNNFSLTWSFIKNISGISVSKLKDWYEVWRES